MRTAAPVADGDQADQTGATLDSDVVFRKGLDQDPFGGRLLRTRTPVGKAVAPIRSSSRSIDAIARPSLMIRADRIGT